MKPGSGGRFSTLLLASFAALLVLALAIFKLPQAAARQSQPTATQSRQSPQAQAARGPEGATGGAKEKTAAEVFKNIQVLKDVPASQWRDTMQVVAMSLGVGCDFCHNTQDLASDEKDQKKTARKMMVMMLDINKTSFAGHPAISCYSCHQGFQKPVGMIRSGDAALTYEDVATPVEVKKERDLPTLDEVIAKYEKAMGGAEALARVTSRVSTGKRSSKEGASIPETIDQKSPDMVLLNLVTPRGEVFNGFDGKSGWAASPLGINTPEGFPQVILTRETQIDPVAALVKFSDKQILGTTFLDGKDGREVFLVTGVAPDGIHERFYFDVTTGLLIRRLVQFPTAVGILPLQVDYDDFRSVDGVQVPFTTMWWMADEAWTNKLTEVKDNVPLEDSLFARPAHAPAPTAPAVPQAPPPGQ